MDTTAKRVIALDSQVISYLGDYMSIYKKSIEKLIRKEINTLKSQVPLRNVPVDTASAHNQS